MSMTVQAQNEHHASQCVLITLGTATYKHRSFLHALAISNKTAKGQTFFFFFN